MKLKPAITLLSFFLICFSILKSIPNQIQAATLLQAKNIISTSLPLAPSVHTIQFQNPTTIPINGKIIITFPQEFNFNGLSSANIVSNNASCIFTTTTSDNPTITCTLTNSVASNTTITIIAGCSSQTNGTCTSEVPTIINPAKIADLGTADIWKMNITTQDASNNDLDFIIVAAATIEGTQISANVISGFTFTIEGVESNEAINKGNTVGCTNNETTNAGLGSSATAVNLGTLVNTPSSKEAKISNLAAQLLTITTNEDQGYALSATASSSLKNIATSYQMATSNTPTSFPQNSQFFGLHPCGADVNTALWTENGNNACSTVIAGSSANECKYAWPSSNSPISLASYATGPVGNETFAGNGIVSMEYAAGIDENVPAGKYNTVITYTATPIF